MANNSTLSGNPEKGWPADPADHPGILRCTDGLPSRATSGVQQLEHLLDLRGPAVLDPLGEGLDLLVAAALSGKLGSLDGGVLVADKNVQEGRLEVGLPDRLQR